MAKARHPLLSLGARGTLGGTTTYQKTPLGTHARTKPIPTDRRTIQQLYQRWLYQDGVYYWHALTPTQKAAWRLVGSRNHMTAFAACMANYLEYLPDIAGLWHLDSITGAIAYDFSKNQNHGVITGAVPTSGIIDGAFYFDGSDDLVAVDHDPSLDVDTEMTIEFFVSRQPGVPPNPGYMTMWPAWIMMDQLPAGLPWFRVNTDIGNCRRNAPAIIPLQEWHHLAAHYRKSPPDIHLYLDGQLWDGAQPLANYGTIITTTNKLYLAYLFEGNKLHCLLDHAIYWNRYLSADQIKRHSERRYPL